MDRYFAEYVVDQSGALTRSLDDLSTSGFIREDAPHWSIEPFIPLHIVSLPDYLIGRGELDPEQEAPFRQLCLNVENIMYERTASYHTRFVEAYSPLDPDSDTRDPLAAPESAPAAATQPPVLGSDDGPSRSQKVDPLEELDPRIALHADKVVQLCQEILQEAGYQQLSQEDVEGCVGVASQWGVPLHVDFDLFHRLVVFARGDIIGTRLRRRLRKLYRRETVAVPIYQRMVVLFQLRANNGGPENLTADALHLRMFKNIPKQDIDMLLPGTRVRISGVDRVKIVLPSLGGFLMSARKVAQYALLLAVFATFHWAVILVVIVVAYLIKSVLSYFQTKNRYQLSLTRNLYFQKLDTNAGVAYRMIQQAHRQSSVEMILAYYAILSHDGPISTRRLRRRCERMIREAIDVEIDFQVDRALERLQTIRAITAAGDRWTVAEQSSDEATVG